MDSFRAFCDRKTREASAARLVPFETLDDHSSIADHRQIGNAWTREHYDGAFHLPTRVASAAPLVSLVFVQSKGGNTGADNPEEIGGGPLDKHLIYEGLSRVAADAVLAGAATAGGEDTFFSVWHPELVALRRELNLPRHPAQIVVTGRACIDVNVSRIFSVPEAPVYVLSSPDGCRKLERAVSRLPLVELITISGDDLRRPLEYLRAERGIARISAVGGRTTASALLDQGLVQDICLTTTAREAGDPDTPLYVGRRPPRTAAMVRKRSRDPEYPMLFEHLIVQR